MINIERLNRDLDACLGYTDASQPMAYTQIQAQIAIAEQLKRIADILDAAVPSISEDGPQRSISVTEIGRFI